MWTWQDIKTVWTILICVLRGWKFRLYRCFGSHVYHKNTVTDSLDTSQITYAMVWEDVRTLRQALHIHPGDSVICVASGGDNALALLLDDPAYIIAVDYSAAQVALCQLKKAAIKHLSYDQFLCLLGVGEEEVNGQSRLEIYEDELRDHLTNPLQRFWDHRKEIIIHGIIYSGIYEKYYLDFAHYICPLVLNEDQVLDILSAKSLDEQAAMIDTYCNSFLWRMLCKLYFGDVLVGRCPPFYEKCDVNTGEHFYDRFNHALRNVPIKDNYFMEYVLHGKLTGNNGLPEYMLPQNFSTLKSRVDRVRFVRNDIADFMRDSKATFDAIDLSNIFDFVPECTIKSHCDTVMNYAAPGARICHWSFVPVKDQSVYQKPFSEDSVVDEELSHEINMRERAWFYQTFTVQTVSKENKQSQPKYRNGITHVKKTVLSNNTVHLVQK